MRTIDIFNEIEEMQYKSTGGELISDQRWKELKQKIFLQTKELDDLTQLYAICHAQRDKLGEEVKELHLKAKYYIAHTSGEVGKSELRKPASLSYAKVAKLFEGIDTYIRKDEVKNETAEKIYGLMLDLNSQLSNYENLEEIVRDIIRMNQKKEEEKK